MSEHEIWKAIPLTQGKFALVDAEDFEFLNQWKWHAQKSGRTFYAVRNKTVGKKRQTLILMHKLLLDVSEGCEIDHINNDGLDNRKINLRSATRSENRRNKTPHKSGTSKYLGVDYNSTARGKKKWRAQIRNNGKPVYLGRFLTDKEAAIAYNNAALKYHGEFANLNIVE